MWFQCAFSKLVLVTGREPINTSHMTTSAVDWIAENGIFKVWMPPA